MVLRDITGPGRWYRFRRRFTSLDRYDLLLALIPVAFAAAGIARATFDVPLQTAIFGASIVGLLVVLDGLFFRPPSGLQGM